MILKQVNESIFYLVKDLREAEKKYVNGLEELELLEQVISFIRDEVADRLIAEHQQIDY